MWSGLRSLVIPADRALSRLARPCSYRSLSEGTRWRGQGQGPYQYCSSAAIVREVVPFRWRGGGDGEQAAG